VKPHIVFIATTPFAVNAFMRTQLLALSKIYDVTLCVNTELYVLDDDVARSVRVVHVDIARKIAPFQDLRALYELFRCFLVLRPNAIHSLMPKAGLLAMLAGCMARVPLRFHTFTGQVWATKVGIARRVLRSVDRLIATCATQVYADSASQCRFLEKEAVVRPGGISVIGAGSVAGVDLARFRPDPTVRAQIRMEAGISDVNFIFLFVGRLVRDKGVFDLVDAFVTVAAAHSDVELWMVGPDEEGLQKELQTRGLKYGHRIRWFGATPKPEQYMAAADMLVLPSYREGFGSVVIEAAACGIPTIAYRIDGIIDSVVDNETGCLVPLGHVDAFAEAMLSLANSAAECQALGKKALLRAIKYFASEAVTTEWLRLYERALRG